MIRHFIIPVFILGIFLFLAATLMATAPVLEPSSIEKIATTVRVVEIQPKSVQLKVNSQGSVMPSTESQLIPEVSGKVSWMSPNLVAGGYFDDQEILIRVDDADYKTKLDRAQANLTRAEAEQQHNEFEYRRMQSLVKRNLVSRSQLENALRAFRVAEASLQDATANFNQAEQDLSRTQIKAPFAGLVRAENVDIGQFVSRGNPIATIYAGNQAEVRLPIADRQLAFLNIPVSIRGEIPKEFQPEVTLTAQYAGQTLAWKGTIVRSEAEIDVSSRMVQLVARVESSSNPVPLSIGLFVSAEIEGLAANNIVVLPREALRNDNQVLIVDKENRLRFRKIDTLRLYQDDLLIKAGLEAGERVCVSPIQTVIEGMKVNPISIEA
ncbi:MAG: efflux RND transporter periplasmic adaptor subunit [Candidatus Azotimanducaceae bacterium]